MLFVVTLPSQIARALNSTLDSFRHPPVQFWAIFARRNKYMEEDGKKWFRGLGVSDVR